MKRLQLIFIAIFVAISAFGQFTETTIAVVNSTSYDDGVSATTIQDKTGPHSAILENTGGDYVVHITNLNTGVQHTITTGVSTVSSALYPITVATDLADTDTSNWELFAIIFPIANRNQAKIVIIDESGNVLYESQEGCEVASKFFGDDGTVSFQNKGADIMNNDIGAVLAIACQVGNTTEFKTVQLPGTYLNCCCDTASQTSVVTNVSDNAEPFLDTGDVWIWASDDQYFWDLELGLVTIFDMKGREVDGFCPLYAGTGRAVHHWAAGMYIATYVSKDNKVKKVQKFIVP